MEKNENIPTNKMDILIIQETFKPLHKSILQVIDMTNSVEQSVLHLIKNYTM